MIPKGAEIHGTDSKDRGRYRANFVRSAGVPLPSPQGEGRRIAVDATFEALFVHLQDGEVVINLRYRHNRSLEQIQTLLGAMETDLADMGFTVQDVIDAIKASKK